MASNGESSSAPPNSSEDDKPVVVRVKRKVSQSLLDAFCELGFPLDFSLSIFVALIFSHIANTKLNFGFVYGCLCNTGLEINERPLKRPSLDFENLSISESSGKGTNHLPLAFRFLRLGFCLAIEESCEVSLLNIVVSVFTECFLTHWFQTGCENCI